ncbi:MAG: helix-turn-helix transcriptional regulator [Gudongella sp.]|nr:helix-turn-helix transcriptional regulator [Gudongella sp.]
MTYIEYSKRQEKIIEIVKTNQPITSLQIAERLGLTRSTLRPDLTVLTMLNILDARPKVGYVYIGKNIEDDITNRISNIFVRDIMSLPVVIEENRSVYDAIVYVFTEDVGTVYVINEGVLQGVVSRKDLLKGSMGGLDLHHTPVGVIMTRLPKLVIASNKDTVISVAIKLIENEIDSIPIVEIIDDEKNIYKVVGRVTKTNITRLFVELGTNL